jgi:hypothetical protein
VSFETPEMEPDEDLRKRAYAMRFDPNAPPPPDEVRLTIGDIAFAAAGNLTGIQGKQKAGKSAVGAAVLGAVQRGELETFDTFEIAWVGERKGSIIHFDTEQSPGDWHQSVTRSVKRSGRKEVDPLLVSIPLIRFARSERLEILRATLAFEMAEHGSIDAVIIDGVADLCLSPNDETEALELISTLHALSQDFNTPIICVIHENPGSTDGKTRGHLGSELSRKAFANLRVSKDSENGMSVIFGTDMRKQEIPRSNAFCFAWDDLAGMHAYRGRAGEKSNTVSIKKRGMEFQEIYAKARESRDNGECPDLSPKEAASIAQDIFGTEKAVPTGTMKKRMERAATCGILRKTALGRWAYNEPGQPGHEWDM